MKAAVWLFCAGALSAQTVTVTGSVTNAITREPVGAVSVVLYTNGATLGANTDASGRFRIPNVKAGVHRLAPHRTGFEGTAREIRIEAGVDPAPLDLTMTPWPGARGRVLDPERQPVARARVRAMHPGNNPGLVYEATTDAAGRFVLEQLEPGPYQFLAIPPAADGAIGPMELAPTALPSSVSLTTGGDLAGLDIVLRAVPVFRLAGRVVDDRGEPAGGATVEIEQANRKAIARGDGTFVLERVLPGDGVLRVTWRRGDGTLRGFAKVTVAAHDLENLVVRVAAPVAWSGEIELDGRAPHPCQGDAILAPVDGQGERAQAEFTESGIRFESVYPGRYRLIVLPGWMWNRHYLEAVRLGERDITLDEVEVSPGMTPFRVALRTGGGRVLGKVENAHGDRVVLMPRDERLRFRSFIVVALLEGGAFALESVRPGEYYAFTVTGSVGIDDLPDRLDDAITVRIERGKTTTVTLAY